MEGNTLRRHHAPQLLRCFAPTRLSEDLLADVYERLLKAVRQASAGQGRVLEGELEELVLGGEHAITTGGQL
jgi:hypothetical protein